jgi:amino acid adenylation domain-containing protein
MQRAPDADVALAQREAALAPLWCEVLRLATVDRDDNFFALGGHSLQATQLMARIRAHWGLALPLAALFESPTLRELAARPEWHGHPAAASTTPRRIHRVPRDAALRTSYSQRRMWLVQQLNPQTTAYNMAFTLRLRGPLDAALLAHSLDLVARRHEAFRTRFVSVDGEPAQLIEAHPAVLLERVDLRTWPAAQREGEARRVLRAVSARRFDLSTAGLHSTSLLQLDDADHVLIWLMHHAIGDQWAAGVLLHEVQQIYTALLQQRPLELAPLAIEFADYAEWQRDDCHGGTLATQLAYWRVQLEGLQALALPTDKPRRGPISGSGGSVHTDLGAARLNAIRQFSVRHRVTPFMTLLAAFDLMLARYSGQTDIAVGVPVANRQCIEAESLVGTLVNTVVMRNRVEPELQFTELLARAKHTALQAYAHQDTPFNTLVQELVPRRDRNFSPLVQVMFNVLNAPYRVDGFDGLRAEAFTFSQGAAQFDLSLTVDTETFGQVQLEYASDLFEEASAQRMLTGYVAVLDRVLADPALTVSGCELMGAAERAELQGWNATQTPFESGLRLGDLIRRQVAASPQATAVVFEERTLSYAELDAAARALALRLRAAGAGPGSLVGVCLERGIELVTALVGVVYSGAAWVPLDPSYPPERVARMCEDAGMSLVLSREGELRRLRSALPPALRYIDVEAAAPPGDDADFALTGTTDDPAYVIFTSGSTGRPKGAMNAHRGVVNWLQWMQAEYGLTPQDRVLLKTPYSFDVSLREFFWPLMTGATIVVARPDGHRDGAYLVELIRQQRISLLHFVPSMLRIFLDEPGLEQCTSVQRVVCSGEALPGDAVELFFQRMPEARLCNLYGPTEAAVEVTYWECRPNDAAGRGPDMPIVASVPIGRPVANTQMHVLDSRLRPQPVGVAGELYIGGVQVGMGYVGRPELTAERFIADPFNPAGRLYKTGDLARWTTDGLIDYLGRADDQVKIRGHRIELGEVEACLGTHAEVARCVVIVREDAPGDKRLVAYVAPRGAIPAVGALREHLRRQVPEYMVPQHVVVLGEIPLLPNGKIDRASLPMPTEAAVVRDASFWVPRTDTEVAMAQIWERLLDIDRVSTTDNFFDLGGHSLLAMRAVSEIHKALGVRIGVRRLVFETLGQLAAGFEAPPGDTRPVKLPKPGTMRYLVSGLQRMLMSRGAGESN